MTPDPAVTAFVEAHLRWAVASAIGRHWPRWRYDLDALRSAAQLGLTIAAQRFDPARGVQFRTFAQRVIDAQVSSDYRNQLRARGFAHISRDTHALARVLTPTSLPTTLRSGADLESAYARQEALEQLLQATPRARDRDVLRLKLEGWSQVEIARRFELSEPTVTRIVQDALRRVSGAVNLRAKAA